MTSPDGPPSALPAPVAVRSAVADLALVMTFAGFVAVCSVLPAVPTGTAVPVTLQTFAVMLTGLVLGPRRAALAVAAAADEERARNLRRKLDELRNQAEPRLPEEVRRLGITTVKSSPDLTMVVHLLSPNDRYDMTYLRNYAILNVKDRLARIDGVGQVLMWGAGDYSMRVWLDPQKVAERGLSAGDVVREIRAQNVQAAAGVVGASPGMSGLDLQLSINAQGRLQSVRRAVPAWRASIFSSTVQVPLSLPLQEKPGPMNPNPGRFLS